MDPTLPNEIYCRTLIREYLYHTPLFFWHFILAIGTISDHIKKELSNFHQNRYTLKFQIFDYPQKVFWPKVKIFSKKLFFWQFILAFGTTTDNIKKELCKNHQKGGQTKFAIFSRKNGQKIEFSTIWPTFFQEIFLSTVFLSVIWWERVQEKKSWSKIVKKSDGPNSKFKNSEKHV